MARDTDRHVRAFALVDEARHVLAESIERADGTGGREIAALREIVRALDEARAVATQVEPARPAVVRWLDELGAWRVGAPRANESFKNQSTSRYAAGLILAVAFHLLAFAVLPALRAPGFRSSGRPLEAVELPPELSIPPPPDEIPRPATPKVDARVVDETITIAATTFEANPVGLPPPPMRESRNVLSDRPRFIPYTVAPELVNRDEVLVYLSELYPRWARRAKMSASVLLYLFIDEQGAVQEIVVVEPSRYDGFDEAAIEVAKQMVWSPAKNRDRAIPVWLMQSITFTPGAPTMGGGIRLP